MTDPKPENAIIPTDPHPKPTELPADLEELIQAGQAELGAHIKTVGDATATRLAEVQRQMEAGEKRDMTPAEKLARAEELLNEWGALRAQARGQKGAFDDAVCAELGISNLPVINKHLEWIEKRKDYNWEARGAQGYLTELEERLGKYQAIITACKKVIDRFRVPGEDVSGEKPEANNSLESRCVVAQALLKEWGEIIAQVPSDDRATLNAAIKAHLGIDKLPKLTTHQATLANYLGRLKGEIQGSDESVLGRTYDVREWLPKYQAIVEAARVVVKDIKKQGVATATRVSPERSPHGVASEADSKISDEEFEQYSRKGSVWRSRDGVMRFKIDDIDLEDDRLLRYDVTAETLDGRPGGYSHKSITKQELRRLLEYVGARPVPEHEAETLLTLDERYNLIGTKENKAEAVKGLLDTWDKSVREIESMGGGKQITELLTELATERGWEPGAMDWGKKREELHRALLGPQPDSPSSLSPRDQEARRNSIIKNGFRLYAVLVERAERLAQDLRARQAAEAQRATASRTDRPRAPREPVRLDATATKKFEYLQDLCSRFLDEYNTASLRLDERERTAKGDHQYRALRETLASVMADFQLVSDRDTLERYAAGEMEVAGGSTKTSDGYMDLAEQLKSLRERVMLVNRTLGETVAEKESQAESEAMFQEELGRAKDLVAMGIELRQWFGTRWDKKILPELRNRASMRYPNIFDVEIWLEDRMQTHQWQGKEAAGDRRKLREETVPMLEEMVGHMRDIAQEMHASGEIKKDVAKLSPDLVRQERVAREQLETKLLQATQAFTAKLDEALRSEGKDAQYRLGAVLSHLPRIVEALTAKLQGDLVLSPAQKKAMLKKCNASVIESIEE